MMWLLYDGLLLLVLLTCTLVFLKKGFAASLLGLLSIVISVVGAALLSMWTTPWIYTTFVRQSLYNKLGVDALTSGGGLFTLLVKSLVTASDNSGSMAFPSIDAAAQSVIRVLAFGAFFIILFLLIKLLTLGMKKMNKLKLVGTLNAALGGVMGFAIGLLLCVLLGLVAKTLVMATGNSLNWINNTIMNNTLFFKWFYNFDFLKLL